MMALAALGVASGQASAEETAKEPYLHWENGVPVVVGEAPQDDIGTLSCSHAHSNVSNAPGHTNANNVNTRQGPHLSCDSNGQTHAANNLTLHCWVQHNTTHPWVWVVNHSRGIRGWIRADFLVSDYVIFHC